MRGAQAVSPVVSGPADALLHALPHPVIMVSPDGKIADANVAAEQFFEASTAMLRRHSGRSLPVESSPQTCFLRRHSIFSSRFRFQISL